MAATRIDMPMPHMASVRPPSARTGMPCSRSNASSSSGVVGTGSGRFQRMTNRMISAAVAASMGVSGASRR